MEGNTHLLQLIRKMRSRIHRLERENRALRGELQGCGQRAAPAPGDADGAAFDGEGPAGTAASPQGSTAAAPAPREQTDTAMTVRRYPTVPAAPAPSSTRSRWAGRDPASRGLPEEPGSARPAAPPAAAQLSREEEKGPEKSAGCVSYSHSCDVKLFQEHVCKCQGKVKAVSFLLPVDISPFAEKQDSLQSPQNQSTKHLMTITEKDM